jgi:hypothetical protein
MGDRVTLAQKLVDSYRTKAIELLVDYLQNKDIRTDAEQYIGQHDPSPARLDTAFEQHHGPLPTRSHHRNVSQPSGAARQNISNARHSLDTPSNSAGSVKSHASSKAAAGIEKILFLSGDDEGTDVPVFSRRATGKYNLIKDQVAYGRGLGAGKFVVDESVVPVHHSSGRQTWENVRFAVNLTWHRPNDWSQMWTRSTSSQRDRSTAMSFGDPMELWNPSFPQVSLQSAGTAFNTLTRL